MAYYHPSTLKTAWGILCFALLLFLSIPTISLAADFSGQVVSVLDGDTIEVLHNNRAERIRLKSIDCPEKGQAYGKKAKQAASELVFGKQVTLHAFGKDKYGRTIADVLLSDGTNVNHELVKQGWCWWYRKYAPGNVILEELERRARGAGRGFWADAAPIPPWEWRKARRELLAEVNECCRKAQHLPRARLSPLQPGCTTELSGV